MSTTVIRPGEISGRSPFKRTVGMALVGLAVAAGIGYAIANQTQEATVAQPNVAVAARADTKFHLQAASVGGTFSRLGGEMGQIPAARVSELDRQMLTIEATKGVELGLSGTAPVFAENSVAPQFTEKTNVSSLFWNLNVTSLDYETALDKQSDQWDSRIDYLSGQYTEAVQPNQSGPR